MSYFARYGQTKCFAAKQATASELKGWESAIPTRYIYKTQK